MKDSLYIVMPAYNEEDNIEKVVTDWYPILSYANDDSRLVIADSGSIDKTRYILEQLQKKYDKLVILPGTLKQHGPKLIALYNYAISKEATYIFQTDSDGQTKPEEFEAFWNVRDKYDCILGHRIRRGDGKSRARVEKVVCILLRLFFGVKVPDANAPFRLMKSSVCQKYMHYFAEDYALPNIMMTTFFSYYNEKIMFQPISFEPRQAGVNSINLKRIFQIGWKSLGEFYSFRCKMKQEGRLNE